MRIGVVSDTHNHVENLKELFNRLLEKKIDVFCHLGDDYDDMKEIKETKGVKIVQVPGVFSEYYKKPDIPNRLIEEWEGKWFLLTHTRAVHKNDLDTDPDPEKIMNERKADIMLFGHTHIPAIIMEGKALLFNPGHLKDKDKKGFPPTYGLIEIDRGIVKAQIIEFKTEKVLYKGEMRI